jgi:hypothetical protein
MLAQLVEQRTFNPFVVGSTPAHPTKNLKETGCHDQSLFLFAAAQNQPLGELAK